MRSDGIPPAGVLGAGYARAVRSEVAVLALMVDAKDDAAEAFYRHHGFERFGTKARQLIVSLKGFALRDGLPAGRCPRVT